MESKSRTDNTRILCTSMTLIFAVSVGAAIAESETDIPQETTIARGYQGEVFTLGESYSDDHVRTWINTGYVDYSDAKVKDHTLPAKAQPQDTDSRILSMTLAEAARHLKPRTEIGHHQYELTGEGALEFARIVQETIREKKELEAAPASAEGEISGVEPESIVPGYGSWYRINSSATNSPYRYVATMDQGAGFCTAEKLINHHTAVTAAHCVQDSNQNWMARQRIRFQAGSANTAYSGTGNAKNYLPSGCYARTVPGCWKGNVGECDYAVITLRGRFGAWCEYNDYNVGYFGYRTVNNEYNALEARMATYPASPPSGTYPSLMYQRRNDAETNNNDWLYYHNDTLGGSSGGPVFNGSREMRAIHVGNLSTEWNVGMRLTTSVINFFKAYTGY